MRFAQAKMHCGRLQLLRLCPRILNSVRVVREMCRSAESISPTHLPFTRFIAAMKRIVLFLATNLAVVLVLSVVARLLGSTRIWPCTAKASGACWRSRRFSASAARSSRSPCRSGWRR